MQFKEFRIFLYLFLLFVFLNLNSNVFAGDNIPSDKEVIYAKNVYKEIKVFDSNESKFLEQIKNLPYSESGKIKSLFVNKFNYTKDYYIKIEAISPTQKFIPIKNTLLTAIYSNLEYLQGVIEDLNNGKNIKDVNSKTATKLKEVSSNYNIAVNKFMGIIQSWQSNYISKVMPVTKIIQTEQTSSEK